MDAAARSEILARIAQLCKKQGTFQLACKKFTQAGDKLKATWRIFNTPTSRQCVLHVRVVLRVRAHSGRFARRGVQVCRIPPWRSIKRECAARTLRHRRSGRPRNTSLQNSHLPCKGRFRFAVVSSSIDGACHRIFWDIHRNDETTHTQ